MLDLSVTEALDLLRLQIDWGADEAIDETPHHRLSAEPPQSSQAAASRSAPPLHTIRAEQAADAADSLDRLRDAVLAFKGCALRDTASHTLFAEGDPASGLLLIGEVPDADEDRAGRVFAGPSGGLLDRMLASIGLSRRQMLIAPLIPWRPPGDRRVNPAEMAACLPFLHRLLTLVRPRHLLLMGTRPARALLETEAPLSRLRGKWLNTAGGHRALAMRHPGQLLANPACRREAWHDLLLLRTTLDAEASQPGESGGGLAPASK